MSNLKEFDISKELWREYDFFGGVKTPDGEPSVNF